jgi:peptide/nickel transport system substrate-binding protein
MNRGISLCFSQSNSIRLAKFVLLWSLFLAACDPVLPTPTILTPLTTPTLVSIPPPSNRTESPATPIPSPTIPIQIPQGGSIIIGYAGIPSFGVTTLPNFLAEALYDSLVEIDPRDGSPRPGLAESWTISDDARTFEFRLRANVQWHDGQILTADDVVFTFSKLSNLKTRLVPTTDFGPLDKITAVDDRTVRVIFKSANCAALANLGAIKILPRHVLEKSNLDQLTPGELIGSGPLKLSTYKAGEGIVFASNRNYWQGAPHIETWTLRTYPERGDITVALANNSIDVSEFDGTRGETPTGTNGARVYTRLANTFYGIAISNTLSSLKDVSVRRALTSAIDRDSLLKEVAGGQGQVLDTSLLPTFWANTSITSTARFDTTRAAQLFAAAGWARANDGSLLKDGKPLSLSLLAIADDPVMEPLAWRIREMLGAAGVKTQLNLNSRNFYLTRLFDHTFDLALVQWNLPLDPDQSLFWNSRQTDPGDGFNLVGYANGRVDQLFDQGLSVAKCDASSRKNLYAQAFNQIAGDSPYVFLFAPMRGLVARNRVGGIAVSPFAGDYWNLKDWFVVGN